MQEGKSYYLPMTAISYNAPMLDAVRSRLLALSEEQGVSLADLSRGAGKNHAYLQQFIQRGVPKKLPEDARAYLADRLGVSEAELGGTRAPSVADVAAGASPIIPKSELIGTGFLNVYAAAQGGDGHMIITFDPIDRVKRPAPLEHVEDGYGILITGDSMDPAYEPGDIALVHPRLPILAGYDAVLFHVPPSGAGEHEALIKRVMGATGREWRLKQHNPAMEFSESRADWPICHRVVGKYAKR